ncbi:MAG TPA: type II secretion system protein [Patescibacteria group bacterium]|nr:type II secretion system protein [Patescibacteria group bacterium]
MKISNKKQFSVISSKQSGFGLVEVIVSIGIMILILTFVTFLAQQTFQTWENAQSKTAAYNLVQRTIEELHNVRDTNIANGLNWDTNLDDAWLTSSSYKDGKKDRINNKDFTTTITITPIQQVPLYINGASTPTPKDGLKKKFTIIVTWKDRNKDGELKGETYLTDWKSKY